MKERKNTDRLTSMWTSLFFTACLFSLSWAQYTGTSTSTSNSDALQALLLLAANPGLLGGSGSSYGGAGFGGAGFGGAGLGGAGFGAGGVGAFGAPFGGPVSFAMPGFGPGGPGGPGNNPGKGQLYLTCKNGGDHEHPGPYAKAAISATVGVSQGQGYGQPYGFGGFGGFYGAGFPVAGGAHGKSPKLSLDVSLSNVASDFVGQIVFTKYAAIDTGCTASNLGDVLILGDDKQSHDPYSKFLVGFGPFVPAHAMQRYYETGVVGNITVYASRASAAHFDNLDMGDLDDLAGRGLAVVTNVVYDGYRNVLKDQSIVTCCALAYDNVPRTLTAVGYPSAGPNYPQPGPSYPEPQPIYPQPQPGPAYPQPGPAYPQPGPSYPRPGPNYPPGSGYPQPGPSYPQPSPVQGYQPQPAYPPQLGYSNGK